MSDQTPDPQQIVANGGWCAPGEAYAIMDMTGLHELPDVGPVAVLRGGIMFTMPADVTPPTAEERERWERERVAAREARKAAGGEWRYAIRITDEDGDVEILDGSNMWDGGTSYSSAEDVISDHRYEIANATSYEVVRRWIADPPEWEVAVVTAEPEQFRREFDIPGDES